MTRLAILSDIHGNLPALDAVIEDMRPFHVDQVIVAGDSINWGPFSVQVMERIFDLRWSAIRGNHEFYMLDHNTPREPEHWKHFVAPRWLNYHLPKSWRDVIASLPDELNLYYPDTPPVKVVHGVPGNHWQGIYPTSTSDDEVRQALAHVRQQTIFTGHTHQPMERRVDGWQIINPGSVGIPLDRDPRAQYMIVDGDQNGWRPTFRRVKYDREPLYAEFERLGFIDFCGATGLLMVEEIRQSTPLIYSFQRWRKRVHNGNPETLDMAREFLSQKIAPEDRHPEYHVRA